MRVAVIGGSGFGRRYLLGAPQSVDTPYGTALLFFAGDTVFCPRHGPGHSLPPHRINYRANIWALWQLGVQRVLATAAVGSLRQQVRPGQVAVVDQFIDWTRARPFTFFDREVAHTDFTVPYCPELRALLLASLPRQGLTGLNGGCYVCTEGPRYETAAEVRALAALGGDVVGMTNLPEVVLAREAGLCYALAAVVTNYGAGMGPDALDHAEVLAVMGRVQPALERALEDTLAALPAKRGCSCPLPRPSLPLPG